MHMINQNLCQNEAENRSTEHPKSYENKTVCASDGSMHEIRSDSTGKEWIDIGGVKKWVRRCPSCGKAVLCPTKRAVAKAITRGIKCKECGRKSRGYSKRTKKPKKIIPLLELTRQCPKCGVDILYKSLTNRKLGDKKNATCKDCYNKSIRKYPTPDKLVRNCPGCGKEIEYTKGKDLSVRRHYWLRDTDENRLCRKCSTGGANNGMHGTHRVGKLNPNYGKRWTDEQRDKAREYWSLKYIDRGYILTNYNPIACEYFDQLSMKSGWKLQHAKNGGERVVVGYFLDAYDKDNNIAVEYDEPYHYFTNDQLKPKDIDRTIKILQNLNCRFIRYNEKLKKLYECRISLNNPSQLQYIELSTDGLPVNQEILSQ